MNAYELADLMLDVTDCESSEYHQAGLMLRQQADRIAELEKAFINQRTQAYANSLTDGTKASAIAKVLNAEPVAYVNSMCNDCIDWKVEPMNIDGKPLYTTPQKYCPSEHNEAYEKGVIDGMAKMTESAVHRAVEGMAIKELSDEEIQEISHDYGEIAWLGETTYNFARAILKKASEK